MREISAALRWGVTVAGLMSLAACGFGGSRHVPPAHAPPRAHAAPPAKPPSAKVLAGMVDAVGPSRSNAPVNLKFAIRSRPQVGNDDVIDYALIPQVPGLDRVRVVFGSLSGLTVVGHDPALTAVKPATGVPIFGSVTVRPGKAGLLTLTAAVAVESPNRSVMWNFGIPVIAGGAEAQTAPGHP